MNWAAHVETRRATSPRRIGLRFVIASEAIQKTMQNTGLLVKYFFEVL